MKEENGVGSTSLRAIKRTANARTLHLLVSGMQWSYIIARAM